MHGHAEGIRAKFTAVCGFLRCISEMVLASQLEESVWRLTEGLPLAYSVWRSGYASTTCLRKPDAKAIRAGGILPG